MEGWGAGFVVGVYIDGFVGALYHNYSSLYRKGVTIYTVDVCGMQILLFGELVDDGLMNSSGNASLKDEIPPQVLHVHGEGQ